MVDSAIVMVEPMVAEFMKMLENTLAYVVNCVLMLREPDEIVLTLSVFTVAAVV
jgi:hypothetical protein